MRRLLLALTVASILAQAGLHVLYVQTVASGFGCDAATLRCPDEAGGAVSLWDEPAAELPWANRDTSTYVWPAKRAREGGLGLLASDLHRRSPGLPLLLLALDGAGLAPETLVWLSALAAVLATTFAAAFCGRWFGPAAALAAALLGAVWSSSYRMVPILGPDALHASLFTIACCALLWAGLSRRTAWLALAVAALVAAQLLRPSLAFAAAPVALALAPLLLRRRPEEASQEPGRSGRRAPAAAIAVALLAALVAVPLTQASLNRWFHGELTLSQIGKTTLACYAGARLRVEVEGARFADARRECDERMRGDAASRQEEYERAVHGFRARPGATARSFAAEALRQLDFPPRLEYAEAQATAPCRRHWCTGSGRPGCCACSGCSPRSGPGGWRVCRRGRADSMKSPRGAVGWLRSAGSAASPRCSASA